MEQGLRICSSLGVASLGEHSWQMQLCVASCAQRCNTSSRKTLLILPLGHAGMPCTGSMGSSHNAGASRQCTSSFLRAGGAWIGCSTKGAAQTTKPHTPHKKLGSGVGKRNHHNLCFPTATTVQRCAQPSQAHAQPRPQFLMALSLCQKESFVLAASLFPSSASQRC